MRRKKKKKKSGEINEKVECFSYIIRYLNDKEVNEDGRAKRLTFTLYFYIEE
jgi:hypothetical protein